MTFKYPHNLLQPRIFRLAACLVPIKVDRIPAVVTLVKDVRCVSQPGDVNHEKRSAAGPA